MRINYYRFPETVDVRTRWENGADLKKGRCRTNRTSCYQCPYRTDDGFRSCDKFVVIDAGDVICGISVTSAKQLLKKFGGSAWTEHCERDGGCFEVTEIQLKGNNSQFKYNHHL